MQDRKIGTGQETIVMTDDEINVELKVGEAFVPKPLEVNMDR